MDPLLSPAFLFRFSTACRRVERSGTQRGVPQLDESCSLPVFGLLEGHPQFADVRMGWHESGLVVTARVTGKSQAAWCRETRAEDSDGLNIWIDTRDAHNIHRATRFCHRFVFLPFGGGTRSERPVAIMLPINRARELPKPVEPGVLHIESQKTADGYELGAIIPAAAITGFDPAEHPRLGFSYAVIDRELGWQTFSIGPEFPFVEDPSLWGTLELVA